MYYVCLHMINMFPKALASVGSQRNNEKYSPSSSCLGTSGAWPWVLGRGCGKDRHGPRHRLHPQGSPTWTQILNTGR